jgi:hypothetical protein
MKQQTAVEILFDRIKLKADSIPTNNQANRLIKGAYVDCLMLIREAKEMEKAQIIEGYAHGHDDGWGLANNKKQEFIHARQYYEQTYGGNKCQETK